MEENKKVSISNKNINDIIAVVKIISLLFCTLVIYNHLSINDTKSISVNFNLYPMGVLSVGIVFIYLLWSFSSMILLKYNNNKYLPITENFLTIIIFSVLIIISKTYIYQYKFLFMFIIITSTLQSGMKSGMIMAVLSSAIILILDVIFYKNVGVSNLFEDDIIMAGIFILTAWPLGYYVEIEQEKLRIKNDELKNLNDELKNENIKRKYMENILLNNDECYNLLIENSKGAIFVHRNNEILFANESAVKLVGFNEDFVLKNKMFIDIIPSEEVENLERIFKKIMDKNKSVVTFESKIINNNANIIHVQNTSTYFTYEGKPAILSILYDISSEKQVEKLKQDVEKNEELLNETRELNNSIIELFANISHELKTPLNVIFSAVQVLQLYKDDKEKNEKYLNIMKQNCYRLMRLINNFLDITKLDSGFLKLDLGNYDIVSVVEDITLSVADYVESKNVKLIFDTNVEEKLMAFDPDKIERIMLNLLSNAIKYSNSNGKILVTLTDEVDRIYISIKDTGIGIPEDKVNMIFERFGQVDKTLKRACEGTGIGLALVKSFVEMHYGSIKLKTSPNEGSEFIIMIPSRIVNYKHKEDKSISRTNIERMNIEFSDIYSE